MLSSDDVVWAYRLFLGRDPENAKVVKDKIETLQDRDQLVRAMMSSNEYRRRGMHRALTLEGAEPALRIDLDLDADEMARLFAHVENEWRILGETEPHWSVSSGVAFLKKNIDQNIDKFFARGKVVVDRTIEALRRNGINTEGLDTVLDYGCGVGRNSCHLARNFKNVVAADISRSHLALADETLKEQGLTNVTTKLMRTMKDIEDLGPIDLFFSVIVLQHNPPPLIAFILDKVLGSLRPGGAAYFQVPTYRIGYVFDKAKYLTDGINHQGMEMHVLPQAQVFKLAKKHGCEVREVWEDAWAGLRSGELSNTFILQKT